MPTHPMRVVIRRTGLSADVLRAWERRYGVVTPERSEGGQRLYSDEDVERLTLLRRATAAGRNISQLASLSREALEALVVEDESRQADETRAPSLAESEAERIVDRALGHIERLEGDEVERLIRGAAVELSGPVTLDQVVVPLLRAIGERWHDGRFSPAHEHLGSAAIRRFLAWMHASSDVPDDAPVVVVATTEGQRHELGAKIAAATAAGEGWRVVYLGADLPAPDIARSAAQVDAVAVAISLIYSREDDDLVSPVARLRRALPPHVLLLAGGAGAVAMEEELRAAGARVLPDLNHFRVVLRSLRPGAAGPSGAD